MYRASGRRQSTIASESRANWNGVPEYVLDHHQEGERERLALMSRLLDPLHRRRIAGLGIGSGARTLEVRCGNGSMSAWLAGRVALWDEPWQWTSICRSATRICRH